ncbi:MAG: hypothetical protein PVH30_11690, partial [Desulfobacterales bacterium]
MTLPALWRITRIGRIDMERAKQSQLVFLHSMSHPKSSPTPPVHGRPDRPPLSPVRLPLRAYSGKAMHILWEYVLRHGERIDRFFDGVDLPRNRLFEKDAWLPYDTASTLWRNTRKCIPNFQMEDSFQIGFSAMTAEGLGALNPVMHLTPVIATLKRLPRLWRTYSRIDHLEVIDIGPDRAVLSYVIDAPFCTDPFCNATLPLIRGFLSALTTRCGLPPASVRELCSCVDVFKRFQLELAHFGHRISQGNRSVFLDGKPAGRWIRIEDEAPVPEPVKRRFKGLRAVLWEREIVDKAPNGSRLILASKGELFNLPAVLLSIEWEDPTPIHRLKGLITCLHRHLNTVGRSKNHMVRRL